MTDEIPAPALTPPCPGCGRRGAFLVPADQLAVWQGGAPARQAFPQLHDWQIEQLETGACHACWERLHEGLVDAVPDGA